MEFLPQRLSQFLEQQQLASATTRLVVAVSGGPDSLALLYVLHALHQRGGPQLHVAHLDHGLRGAESAAEAQFVATTAAQLGFSATIELRPVADLAQAAKRNLHDIARSVRYAFLAEVAQQQQAHAVVTAHHADDQAETVLLHLLRGAGPAGLRAMRAVVPWAEWQPQQQVAGPPLIRPLLSSSHDNLVAFCAALGLVPCDDPSNRSPHYTRTRVRSTILPALRAENPQIVAALNRTASLCAEDYAFIQGELDRYWPRLVRPLANGLALNYAVWSSLPAALQSHALRRAVRQLTGDVDELSYDQIAAARATIAQGDGARYHLGARLWLTVIYTTIVLSPESHRQLPPELAADYPQLPVDTLILPMPGRVPLGNRWYAEITQRPSSGDQRWTLALHKAQMPLLLRRRRPGDRFRPQGGRGSRSLQNYFVDQKVPRAFRDAWPILATAERVLWVVGYAADESLALPADQTPSHWLHLFHLDKQ
jgi:tRNA(Ile)-lysidine synthase